MTKLALVTGATGLVGSHVVQRLTSEQWDVRALVRDPRASAWAGDLGVTEFVRGDVLDAAAYAAAAKGCEAIFHTAAAITPGAGDWESYRRVNVDGTQAAIGAAKESGARLLHVSSVAVYGPTARFQESGAKTVESLPLATLPEHAFYARSKRESEQLVLDAHAAGDIWATAIRPDVIYGRRDRQFVPRMARLLRRAHFFPLPGGGKNTLAMIHASSVADAAFRAVTTDAAGGKAYNVANEDPVTLREFVQFAAYGLDTTVIPVPIPLPVLKGALAATKRIVKWLHLPGATALQHATLGFVARDNPFSSELAQRELGWSPVVSPREAIPDAFNWWVRHYTRDGWRKQH
jgi:nucleoside-diphosphate-sugar epimerase